MNIQAIFIDKKRSICISMQNKIRAKVDTHEYFVFAHRVQNMKCFGFSEKKISSPCYHRCSDRCETNELANFCTCNQPIVACSPFRVYERAETPIVKLSTRVRACDRNNIETTQRIPNPRSVLASFQ